MSIHHPDIILTIEAPSRQGSLGREWPLMVEEMSPEERRQIEREMERLKEEHRDLDAAIVALTQLGQPDQLQLQRLKKRKLVLRDRIAFLDDQVTPDIIA